MDNIIKQVAKHFLSSSESGAIRNFRLTQMFYLADWKNCIVRNEQITNIKWEINNIGPFSSEVLKTIIHNRDIFNIKTNLFNKINFVTTPISLSSELTEPTILQSNIIQVLDFVTRQTKELDSEEFISLISSTYPVFKSKRFSTINLKALSIEYRSSRFWNDKALSFDL